MCILVRICVCFVFCVCWRGTPAEDDGGGVLGGGGDDGDGGGGGGVAVGSSGGGWLRPDVGVLDGARGAVDFFHQSWHSETYRTRSSNVNITLALLVSSTILEIFLGAFGCRGTPKTYQVPD